MLLDLNLPDGNGLAFLTALRRTSGVPVLILTANDLESDQVAGLELGADDYVTKPFSLAVLRARVNRLLRRGSARRPRWGGGPSPSTLSACALCGTGRRWSCPRRSSGCCACWWSTGADPDPGAAPGPGVGRGEFVDANALSVAVKRLRDKLTDAPIKTVYGLGYTWEEKR